MLLAFTLHEIPDPDKDHGVAGRYYLYLVVLALAFMGCIVFIIRERSSLMSSEVGGHSPLEIFQAGEAELLGRVQSHQIALTSQTAAAARLSRAEARTQITEGHANDYGMQLLERIHESVTPDTDPGEYLAAVLNTFHSGQHVGDEIAERLSSMRDQIRQEATPVAIVGATLSKIVLGLSAGDVIVRPRKDFEQGFDTRAGIRLEIPLTTMSGYGRNGENTYFEQDWQYLGNYPQPTSMGVVQRLSALRLVATQDEVRQANDTPHRPFSEHDTVMHHERQIKSTTGFVPVVAYGKTAVSGVLAALYESRNAKGWGLPPKQDEVLAAAINLGLSAGDIANIDEPSFRDQMHSEFLKRIVQGVRLVIQRESHNRQFPGSWHGQSGWSITGSPQIMRYTGIEPSEVTNAIRKGVEESFDQLRVDNPLDVRLFTDKQEYRLTEDEAREHAIGLIAARYGLTVEPAALQSANLDVMFAARIAEKLAAKRRRDTDIRIRPPHRRSSATI